MTRHRLTAAVLAAILAANGLALMMVTQPAAAQPPNADGISVARCGPNPAHQSETDTTIWRPLKMRFGLSPDVLAWMVGRA